MNPIFFGSSEHQLFGIYNAPARGPGRTGVVLCYPWGQEYMRAHRAFRFLGAQLAGAGLHALRFDYWGTGNSGGDLSDAGPASWITDIGLAVQELSDMADIRRISLCGLRVGAYWAAEAATEMREVDRVVLWDPILDGAGYVRALDEAAVVEDGRLEVDGFLLTDQVRGGLSAASPDPLGKLGRPTLVLQTEADTAVSDVIRDLGACGEHITKRFTAAPPAWKEEDGDFGTSGMPVEALREIVEWLTAT